MLREHKPTNIKAKAWPTPSFAPTPATLLQRKCACGGTPGLSGECAECRRKRLTLQRRSANQAEPSALPTLREPGRSPNQPLDSNSRPSAGPLLGHDFGRVRVYLDALPVQVASASV